MDHQARAINTGPLPQAARGLLAAAVLPSADLTDEQPTAFFYCGPAAAPSALVGLEIHGTAAAVSHGVEALYLLTTTAEPFFVRLGYPRRPARGAALHSIHARIRPPVSGGFGVHDQAAQKERQTMKRLHVHVSVRDIPTSIRFYRELFSAEPVVTKPDYAKWMLDDPRVNFAISQRNRPTGVDHLGIQVEDRAELAEVYGRLKRAKGPVIEEGEKTCCYANSEKSWINDPQGVEWETFLATGESTVYGTDVIAEKSAKPCCTPNRAA